MPCIGLHIHLYAILQLLAWYPGVCTLVQVLQAIAAITHSQREWTGLFEGPSAMFLPWLGLYTATMPLVIPYVILVACVQVS